MDNICLTGKVEGKRVKGIPRTLFLDSLVKFVRRANTPSRLLWKTVDRSEWRLMVAYVLADTVPR